MTALMWAAFHGRTEQVRVLIAKGADPSAKDMDGMTAVHWSVQKNDTRVLQVYTAIDRQDHLGSANTTFLLRCLSIRRVLSMWTRKENLSCTKLRSRSDLLYIACSCHSLKTTVVYTQGSSKSISLIKAVRPISVNDFDENG